MSKKSWTIMIYMAGDNNLSFNMVYSLKEIKEVVKQKNNEVNLLVYYDGGALDTPTLYCDFTEFEKPFYVPAYKVEKRFTHKRRDVTPVEDENSAAMYSLLNFVDWCVSERDEKRGRKADNYAFIVSGHGFGFQNISFLKDDQSNYYMTIRKFRASLKAIEKDILGKPIEVLGFDNCVMSMLEIGNEIHEHANVMVASEGSIPNAGWSYGNILGELVNDSEMSDGKKLGEKFVRAFIEGQQEFAIGGVSVDMAAWDLSKVKEITNAVNSLGEILYKGLKNADICKQLELVLLQTHFKCQSYMFEQNVDLKDFCQILSKTSEFLGDDLSVKLKANESGKTDFRVKKEIANRCKAVTDAVDKCVLLSGFSGGAYQYSNGISIFFPWTYLTYTLSKKTYEELRFTYSDAKYWNDFLRLYLGAVSLRESNGSTINDAIVFENFLRLEAAGNAIDTDNAENKAINNAADKTTSGAAKFIEERASKIANNAANKIANNAANKLLDTLGLTLVDFKNVAAPWYVTGFTKKEAKKAKAGVLADRAEPE